MSATLDINAAETFDGLARAAVSGAVRMFAAPAVIIIEMPDGQVRRIFASPQNPEPIRQGGPAGLVDRVVGQVLGPEQASGARILCRRELLGMVPDSALDGDVCLAAARILPGRPPVAIAVGRDGVPGEVGITCCLPRRGAR